MPFFAYAKNQKLVQISDTLGGMSFQEGKKMFFFFFQKNRAIQKILGRRRC